MAIKTAVILADGFEEIEAVTIIDLLRRAGITVAVLGLDSVDVRGSHEIYVIADAVVEDFKDPVDALILPGGTPGTGNLAQSDRVLALVKETFGKGKLCAALCAAPTVLAKAGVLAGKKATCYPGLEDRLEGAQFVSDAVVTDGNVITSRGAGTAIAFALAVVAYLTDENRARTVADNILAPVVGAH